MSFIRNLLLSALFYLLLFCSFTFCRISDKKKCANADCSEPISFATTLLRYNADDDRLLSFPRNLKVKVFSKEAGDTPNFWEVEEEGSNQCMNIQGSRKYFLELCQEVVRGKRGYVPKGLLREDKVLVPRNKLTHIVPTGRTDSPKPNITNVKSEELETNPITVLSATPKLPTANSKGLFSTIGGVSADSVPMNSPDIKPQSTRKFQVFDGTTIYEDVVSEKPESPPTLIEDSVDGKQESDGKQSSLKQIKNTYNDRSSETKPVHESNDENNEVISEDKKEQPQEGGEEPPGEPTFLSHMINRVTDSVSKMIASGAGESNEDELEENEGEEEEDYADDEEEETITEEKFNEPAKKYPFEQPQSEEKASESIRHSEMLEDVTLVNKLDNSSFSERQGDISNNNHDEINQDSEVLAEERKDSNHKATDDIKSTNSMEMVENHETDEYDISKVSGEGVEVVSKFSQSVTEDHVDKTSKSPIKYFNEPKVEEKLGSDELQNQPKMKSQDFESYTDGAQGKEKQLSDEPLIKKYMSDSSYHEEKPTDEPPVPDQPKVGEVKAEQQSKTDEPLMQEQAKSEESQVDYLENNKLEAQKLSKSDKLIQEESSTDKSQLQKPKADEPHVEEQPNFEGSEVQEEIKTEEPKIQEQSKIEDPQVEGKIKTEELHTKKQPKTDESQNEEQPKIEDPESQGKMGTDEPLNQKQPIIEESQIQGEIKNNITETDDYIKISESQNQEYPEVTTQLPVSEPTTIQYSSGSGQLEEKEKTNETLESIHSNDHYDDINSETNSMNHTSEVKLSSPYPMYSIPKEESIESPKYTSVINKRIQSPELSPDSEKLSDSGEDTNEEPSESIADTSILETSGNILANEETLSSNPLFHSQSPKYSAVVNNRIGSVKSYNDIESETIPGSTITSQTPYTESVDEITDKSVSDIKSVETINVENLKNIDDLVDVIDESHSKRQDDVSPSESIVDTPIDTAPEEGIFSWAASFIDVFGSKDSRNVEESSGILENSDTVSSHMTHLEEETCSADGAEGDCPTLSDTMHNEVTWQETSYTSDIWVLLEKVPLEATIWLIVTAVVVLIFSLGHYYIEAHRRDGPLVAIINKLERELLILRKERCIMEDRLNIAEQQLDAWNTSSSENDALLIELKQELEEVKAAKAELEEQTTQLKEELETVTESGLEMHRLLEESLSSQDGSQVLLSTVETLREKLQRQEEEISGLSDTLSSKNAEVEELQGALSHATEVARSLEDRVIAVTREKEEELLQLRDKQRGLISQLEEVMETKALEETRLSTEMSKLRLTIEELQKTLAEKDSELDTLKEVVKQLRSTDSNEKMEALFDVVSVQAKLKTAVTERDDFREKFMEEEGARKLLEGHMKKITQEVAELKNSFETAEKEKIEALTKLQVLSNYFKEKESQLQKELGLQESMWLQKQSDDHTIYEQMRSLREENEKYKLQNESLKKEIVEQEASFKIQLANTEQKAHENWVASRQAERKVKEAQQEAAQLRNRLTMVEKNSANYSLDEKPNISESNGDPSSPPPSLMFPPTTSPPFMMYGPPIPPPGDFVPPPPLMGSPYPTDSRPPPLGRISSPPLDHRFSPPPPLPYPPYDYPPYGHHSPSPPPPLPQHHRNVHKPQPRELSREQKDHVPSYSPEGEKSSRRNKR